MIPVKKKARTLREDLNDHLTDSAWTGTQIMYFFKLYVFTYTSCLCIIQHYHESQQVILCLHVNPFIIDPCELTY